MAQLKHMHTPKKIKRSDYRRVHSCKKCPYFTKSTFLMINHLKQHHIGLQSFDCERSNLELYYCKNCSFESDVFVLLNTHIKEEHSKIKKENYFLQQKYQLRNFICKTCSFQTFSVFQWFKHDGCSKEQKNIQERYTLDVTTNKFKCNYCEFTSNWKCSVIQHYKSKHIEDDQKEWFQCQLCPYKSARKADLAAHHNNIHTDDQYKKWIHCDKCTYRTTNKNNLKRHLQAKHEMKIFKCENCKFQTKWKHVFDKHDKFSCDNFEFEIISEHNPQKQKGNKLFKCKQCSYKAKVKYNFDKHFSAIHMTEKNWFNCEKCEYKTTWKGALLNHFKSKHTFPKKKWCYECEKCLFRAKRKYVFLEHKCEETVLHKIKLKCDKCNYTTVSKTWFKKHNVNKHALEKNDKSM